MGGDAGFPIHIALPPILRLFHSPTRIDACEVGPAIVILRRDITLCADWT